MLRGGFDVQARFIGAGDTFFGTYLLMACFGVQRTAEELRARAAVEDEGMALVVLIIVGAITICCGSVFSIIHTHARAPVALAFALASAPLGWFALNVVAAFHYANLYYRPHDADDDRVITGGLARLIFPGDCHPAAWDFVYFSFVVGMTCQVSDVQITDPKLRRATTGHSVISFFFNTVMIAMAVNAAVTIFS